LPFIPTILDQHAEEAALLWLRRDDAVGQPHYKLDELAELDNQLEANLDGLRIANAESANAAWEVCERELKWGEPGEVFAAAMLACEADNNEHLQRVLAVAVESHENSRAFISAMSWLPYERVAEQLASWLATNDAFLRRTAIAACAAHGHDPGEPLAAALTNDAAPTLRSRALRAVGELARTDLLPAAREQLDADDSACRFAAAWSVGQLAGDPLAIEILHEYVQPQLPTAERALSLAIRLMPPEAAAAWSAQLIGNPQTARLGVQALGGLGLPAVPTLLSLMPQPELARVAGEAFAMITGVDVAYEDLEGEWPTGFSAGPTEDPEDENVDMDPDENLPWPHVGKLRSWWEQHGHEFDPNQRYLCGQPITDDSLQHVLRHGFQRQRAAAALELAIRHPEQALFNVRAPGPRQQRLLGLK
jgi:uncharacterized protein (TIGR02270 family)